MKFNINRFCIIFRVFVSLRCIINAAVAAAATAATVGAGAGAVGAGAVAAGRWPEAEAAGMWTVMWPVHHYST
jgi:hypothetical protein